MVCEDIHEVVVAAAAVLHQDGHKQDALDLISGAYKVGHAGHTSVKHNKAAEQPVILSCAEMNRV